LLLVVRHRVTVVQENITEVVTVVVEDFTEVGAVVL
jgi:hypothetical protein